MRSRSNEEDFRTDSRRRLRPRRAQRLPRHRLPNTYPSRMPQWNRDAEMLRRRYPDERWVGACPRENAELLRRADHHVVQVGGYGCQKRIEGDGRPAPGVTSIAVFLSAQRDCRAVRSGRLRSRSVQAPARSARTRHAEVQAPPNDSPDCAPCRARILLDSLAAELGR
jgi:hypothetical protein